MTRYNLSLVLFCLTFAGSASFALGQAEPASSARSAHSGPAEKVATLDLDGLRNTLARDPAKKRPLLLNFWATWCDPCREEFPDLVKLANEFGPKGLDFAAVSFDFAEDANTEIPKFLKQVNAQKLPVYWYGVPDPEPAIKMVDPEWGGGIPITFLFDGDGKIVFKHMGRFNLKELREAVEKQVNGK